MRTRKSVWLAMLLLVLVLLVVGVNRQGSPQTQQERIDSITSNLACPTCSGESVYDSRAIAAESIRSEVARQVGSGLRSDDEILSYIEQRFGGRVLLVPRATGIDSLVWALPVAALIFSAFLLYSALVSKRTSLSGEPEEQLKFLTKSLNDLKQENKFGDLDDQEFALLSRDYESRIEAVHALISNLGSKTSTQTVLQPERNLSRTVITTMILLVVASMAGWFVAQQSGQRLAGDSLAGSIEDSTASILSRARATNFVDPKAAIELYTEVLTVDPDNVEALTYRAWLLALIARSAGVEVKQLAFESASRDLERAIALDPSYPDAHCFLGIARFRLANDASGAKEQLTICAEKNPPAEVKGFVDSIVAEVDAVLAG